MKISIVIPCYKAEKFISDIIHDVLAQTFVDYELIIVSNGIGRYAQENIVKRIIEQFPDKIIRLISTDEGGVSKARNKGIEQAQGDFITFLDADDRIEPNYLSILFNGVKESDIVIGGYTQYFEKEDRLQDWSIDTDMYSQLQKDWLFQLGWNVFAPPYAKLYSKKILMDTNVRFDEDLSYMEDGIFNLRLFLKNPRNIHFVRQTGYRYICRDNMSAISIYHPNLKKAWEVRSQLILEFHKTLFPEKSREKLKNGYVYLTAYESLQNIFKQGNPYSFKEKRREVKKLLFEDETTKTVLLNNSPNDRLNYIIFNKLYSTRSPLILTSAYCCMHFFRQRFSFLYYKVKPLFN